ncbi:MAG TPA: hypothetical protein VFX59_23125 [Polyangiales bacterium]|nr:hypothetical protein [Polyangiales bacterium]
MTDDELATLKSLWGRDDLRVTDTPTELEGASFALTPEQVKDGVVRLIAEVERLRGALQLEKDKGEGWQHLAAASFVERKLRADEIGTLFLYTDRVEAINSEGKFRRAGSMHELLGGL